MVLHHVNQPLPAARDFFTCMGLRNCFQVSRNYRPPPVPEVPAKAEICYPPLRNTSPPCRSFNAGAIMAGFKGSVLERPEMVPGAGIEPATFGLQNRCSTN